MTTETATPMIIRSAGRSRKGAGKYNWDYLCQVEYPAGSRVRGLYGVADGSPSPSRGDLASELSIETLKEYFHHTRSGRSDGPSEASNLLKTCFSEINRSLLDHRIAKKEGEEKAYPMYSTLTAGYQIDNTFHIGHTGAGAVYVIAGGEIQRLTEEHSAAPPHETPPEVPGVFAPGLLGWKEHGFSASFLSIPLESSTTLIFCTDGVTAHISSLALLEAWLETRSPEGMVERVINKLDDRGAAEDASLVVFQMETQQEVVDKFVRPIRYPAHVIFKKHLIVLILLTVISSLVVFREAIVSRIGSRNTPASAAAGKQDSGKLIAAPGADRSPRPTAAAPEPVFTLTTEPEDGVSIRLNRKQEEYGSIKIQCDGGCDEILIDGIRVKASFPRNFLHHIGVRPGTHEVRARSGENTLTKKVGVAPEKTAELRFEFPGAAPVAAAAPPVHASRPAPPPPAREPAVSRQPAPQTLKTERVSRVFFTVKTDVPGSALMIFQGGSLVLTGTSGQRLDLPPGEYLIEAVNEGYDPVVKNVTLNQRLQMVEMRLK